MVSNPDEFDEEQLKRFERAMSPCRTCRHIRMAHSSLSINKGKCLDSRLTNKEVHEPCACRLFIPAENLEYLEWVAENKGK
jgi:hypothetical protein